MTKDEFITERTNIISEMLDNPDKCGIYPTTECFRKLDNLFDRIVRETFPCRAAPQENKVEKSNNTQRTQRGTTCIECDDIQE